jgi:ubiquinone biosynthesis protein COQ9
MAQPSYVPYSISELGRLSDEMWFLAGDTSVDTSWYTKRGTLAVIYASAEVYQTQDTSPNFTDTEKFVDSRLEELRIAGQGLAAVTEWAGFTARGFVNVLRSKGVQI